MSDTSVETLRLIGGHPALDFVNTVDAGMDRRGPDVLATYGDAIDWAVRVELITKDNGKDLRQLTQSGDGPVALERLIEARENLYKVLLAEALGQLPDTGAVAFLSQQLREASSFCTLCFDADSHISKDWIELNIDSILHRVIAHAVDLLTDRKRRPISLCDGVNCGWLFLDRSRSGRRRWCSEEGCGSHARVRKFRAKTDQINQ